MNNRKNISNIRTTSRPWRKRRYWAIVGVTLCIAISGCSDSSSSYDDETLNEKSETTIEAEESHEVESEETTTASSSQKANYQIGDTISTDLFGFTIVDAYTMDYLGEGKKIPEGAVYVVLEFEYKNISKQPINSFDLPTVCLMDANDAVYNYDSDASWYFDGYSDEKIISDMNPGIKTKGTEIFEVSTETLSEGGMKAYVKEDKEFLVDLNLSHSSSSNSDNGAGLSYSLGNAKADSFYEEDLRYQQSETVDINTPYYSDAGDTMKTPYILIENSSTEYLSDSDIYWMTPQQLRYAKNEIYARHGRKFKDAELQAWFDAQEWYDGTIAPEAFDDNVLSEIEKKNIQVLQHRLEVNSQ